MYRKVILKLFIFDNLIAFVVDIVTTVQDNLTVGVIHDSDQMVLEITIFS